MKQLYLIGTYHSDLKGPHRLSKLLDHIKPSLIGVEYSHHIAQEIIQKHLHPDGRTHINHLKFIQNPTYTNLNPEFTFTAIKSIRGYEIWVPYEYQQIQTETTLYPIDTFASEEVKEYSHAAHSELLDALRKRTLNGSEKFQEWVDQCYDEDESIDHFPESEQNLLFFRRDERVEANLRMIFAERQGDMVYIGGVSHFFDRYHNLYDRLKDLNPIRIKLKDADKLEKFALKNPFFS